jgi:hypothetical protein
MGRGGMLHESDDGLASAPDVRDARGRARPGDYVGDVDFHFGIVRPLRALALAPRSALLL